MHFDEELNCYSSSNSLRVRDAELLTAAWWAFQEQQLKVEGLKGQLIKLGFSDKGGQLMKPPLGTAPIFELLDERPLCKKRARNFSHGESWSFILLILWLFLIAGIGLFYLFRWLV